VAFRGTFDHTLDAKNRLTIPAKFRAALSEGVVVSPQPDITKCVAIWRPEDYEAHTRRTLDSLPSHSPEAASLRRFFYGNSFDTELDAAGRVMLPSFLLEHAGLDREVVITGGGDYLEVWSRADWADYKATLVNRAREMTASIGQPA